MNRTLHLSPKPRIARSTYPFCAKNIPNRVGKTESHAPPTPYRTLHLPLSHTPPTLSVDISTYYQQAINSLSTYVARLLELGNVFGAVNGRRVAYTIKKVNSSGEKRGVNDRFLPSNRTLHLPPGCENSKQTVSTNGPATTIGRARAQARGCSSPAFDGHWRP